MKGPSPSTKRKASRVKAAVRPLRYNNGMRNLLRIRRSQVGAKLASYSSSDGSPERPVKVVVSNGDVGGGGNGGRISVPVFGGGNGIPRSSDNIGETRSSSVSVPKMGAGGGRLNESVKMGACSVGRLKEAVKLEASGSDGSPEHVVKPGRSRLRIDSLGHLHVLDSEDEGNGMEVGLYTLDSEEGRRAVVASIYSKVEMATVADPAPKVAVAADVLVETADVPVEIADVPVGVADVPVGAAAAPDELHPALQGLLIVFVIRVGQLLFIKLDVNTIRVHANVVYDIIQVL